MLRIQNHLLSLYAFCLSSTLACICGGVGIAEKGKLF